MITRSQKNKQAPAECSAKKTRQRPRPIHSPPAPFKQCSNPALDPPLSDLAKLPEPRGRKRRRASEPDRDRPAKGLIDQVLARDPPPDPAPAIESALWPSFTPLTKKHLDELERLSGISASNSIGRAATPLGRGGKKRPLSSQNTDVPRQEEDPRAGAGAGAEALYMSPASSGSTMPPPALPPTKQDTSSVKTPRPDITVGLRLGHLIDALKSKGLGQIEAQDFLKDL
ncbi:MAG: hypothetical protein Q9172_004280 [Xanthocarpia lactea]